MATNRLWANQARRKSARDQDQVATNGFIPWRRTVRPVDIGLGRACPAPVEDGHALFESARNEGMSVGYQASTTLDGEPAYVPTELQDLSSMPHLD
jgi:hypothetical protein